MGSGVKKLSSEERGFLRINEEIFDGEIFHYTANTTPRVIKTLCHPHKYDHENDGSSQQSFPYAGEEKGEEKRLGVAI
jgi:hypothetical protein